MVVFTGTMYTISYNLNIGVMTVKIIDTYSDGYGVGMLVDIKYDNHIYTVQLAAGESDSIQYHHIDHDICYVISTNDSYGYKGLQLIDLQYIIDKAIPRTRYSYIQCKNITYYPLDSVDSILVQGDDYYLVENMDIRTFIDQYSILLGGI